MARPYKELLKNKLGRKYYRLIKSLYLGFRSLPYGFNLNRLALIYQSDKWGKHFYTRHYQSHFRRYKFKRIKLLEIGVGGYHFPDRGGNSLRMWKRYFPFARIFALDLYDKSFVEERRIKVFQGSQADEVVLNNMMDRIGEPEIIIDDGSHINEHVITTFKVLFPRLKDGGIYVVEDTETSYWPDYGGDSENLSNPSTMMNYFKSLLDGLNHQEFVRDDYKVDYFDRHIVSVQFYHNLIFIYKGLNDEPSNIDPENPDSIRVEKVYV